MSCLRAAFFSPIMKTIVLAVDFELQSEILIDKAQEYASAFKADLHLIHVSTLSFSSMNYLQEESSDQKQAGAELRVEKRLLKKLCDKLEQSGINANYHLLEGENIGLKVLEQAEKLGADLIISGYHQRNFILRSFIKSSAESVLHNSKIPILVIPLEA